MGDDYATCERDALAAETHLAVVGLEIWASLQCLGVSHRSDRQLRCREEVVQV